ncbi:NADH dehydrogenase (quinone) [Anaeromyxobacter dehalogenans 2CP-1]|uniref:NADH dehydrogenase (Quinone) n=1 Tax=Anaeromyxobacter dehalogenans (strain ATCC BAA-258 / DSM 21875 / 2CP-1) TaxID=455488 RepID=B8J7D9_ANAD2|nr:proton-conducting transporter membrane subunit [Anaeromyxobacter dehalogenans]ACL67119.1 NADH dehydrogenase (quinone) [Anaeromyxobacter dehalogenans 2CP-1]
MTLYLAAVGVLVAGGLVALAASARPRLALAVGSVGAALGCALGLAASLAALRAPPAALDLSWPVPSGALALGLDPLSAAFATAIFALGLAASVYGAGYLRPQADRRSMGPFALFFALTLASMALVVAARQAVLFLVAWEGMTAASFLLVAHEHEDASVRRAARTYLVASHLGAAFLFALFLVLGREAGSLRFEAFAALRAGGAPAALLVLFALVGFGTKAGLVPLHVWLPEAHPAAPSHVSALMSGVLVKMGVYGILRVLTFLPPAPAWAGLLLAGVGLVGALAALALALGQRDLKRVLAYSTVENVGIIALAAGLGLVGAAVHAPLVAALGVTAALLHVWNHALMKGLAFLGAGALVHGAGTRDLERMGGLLRRLPVTGGLLVLAAVALCGLPPLNGFVSEWLVYLGLLQGGRGAPGGLALAAWLALAALALVGALAAVVFTRLLGTALLGEPRSEEAAHAHEAGPLLLAPLALLGAGNVALALFPAHAAALLAPAAAQVLGTTEGEVLAALAPAAGALAGPLRAGVLVLVALGVGVAIAARRLRAGRPVAESSTWGCGFSAASPRVQYTAASYAQLALDAAVPRPLRPRARLRPPEGAFPAGASLALEGDDPARTRVFEPAFQRVGGWFSRLRSFQQARLNLQLLYTVAALLGLTALLLLRYGP